MTRFFRKYPAYKFLLAAIDWLTCNALFVMAVNLRGLKMFEDLMAWGSLVIEEVAFLVVAGVMTVLVFQYFNLYKINVFITVVDHAVHLARAIVVSVIGIALLSFLTKASWVIDSRLVLLYYIFLAFGGFLFVRVLVFRKLFQWFSHQGIYFRNVLIVGAGQTGKELAVNLFLHPYSGLRVVGFLDDDVPLGKKVFGQAKVIGRVAELVDCVKLFKVREVIICVEHPDYNRLIKLMELATSSRAMVKISSPLYEVIPSRLFIEKYGTIPVVSVAQSEPSPLGESYKKLVDKLVASMVLLVLSPVLLIIGTLIKLDSAGPVFFRQTRIGKNGRPFTFYKFRSMQVGSDKDEGRMTRATQFIKTKKKGAGRKQGSTKIVNEARVTRVGRWLRQTSLDELPQLLNVLKGDMSLVGPRPCLPYEWEQYEEWHRRRLSVLPGCTGVWQVSGRSVVGFEDMVILDLYYIQNASALLDMRLLLKTIPVMLLGTGAK